MRSNWKARDFKKKMLYQMSHVKSKPVFAICEQQKGADQPAHLRSQISAFVIRCSDSIIPLCFYIQNFKPLATLWCSANRFESDLVGNPEDRFSHDEAQICIAKNAVVASV